ncbi:MAG: acetate/propionate family kinase [Magnetovibrionaceae bacterium]
MSDAVLVLNAGSSSFKFTLYRVKGFDAASLTVDAKGQVEGLGLDPHFVAKTDQGEKLADEAWGAEAKSHKGALAKLLPWLTDRLAGHRLLCVGHRVVHGGPDHATPERITPDLLETLRGYEVLAPLHQPHNLAAIQAVAAVDPALPQIACFDTAFHRGHPAEADWFALPRSYHEEGVRRYGFHGLSYEYIANRLSELDPDLAAGRVVVAHLGSGASICAIQNGQSMDSSMGFTALDGLPMGTRPGQLDAGVALYLMAEKGMDAKALEKLFYKESGLKGLSGLSNDMRDLRASDAPEATFAIAYFTHHIVRQVGALAAVMGGLDGLVFTAGIGEKDAQLRADVLKRLGWLGFEMDEAANIGHATTISTAASLRKALVIPTDEEGMIARHSLSVLATDSLAA